jgi:tetratricopeptide (TPR) repeat protein
MSPADELFAEADRLEEIGDQQGALLVWRELAERFPDPGALCRLGGLAKELGEIEEAENALWRAIKLDSGFADDLESIIDSHREPLSPPLWD